MVEIVESETPIKGVVPISDIIKKKRKSVPATPEKRAQLDAAREKSIAVLAARRKIKEEEKALKDQLAKKAEQDAIARIERMKLALGDKKKKATEAKEVAEPVKESKSRKKKPPPPPPSSSESESESETETESETESESSEEEYIKPKKRAPPKAKMPVDRNYHEVRAPVRRPPPQQYIPRPVVRDPHQIDYFSPF